MNKEELAVGFIIAGAWIVFLKAWLYLAFPLVAFLWALGGSEDKSYRRYGVPGVLIGCILLAGGWNTWLLASAVGLIAVLSMGYGIPTWDQNNVNIDEGSFLGRICYKLVGGKPAYWDTNSQEKATMLCRGFVGALIALALVPLAWVSLGGWIFGAITCAIGYPLVVKIVE